MHSSIRVFFGKIPCPGRWKIIFLTCLVALFATLAPLQAAQVTVAWDQVGGDVVGGYKLYCGSSSGEYHQSWEAGSQTNKTRLPQLDVIQIGTLKSTRTMVRRDISFRLFKPPPVQWFGTGNFRRPVRS